ncbi:hypothetical protein Goarm_006914 [Gossypium armourianum]|uniref:Uncharacterized protein n=1 Tax=Gossypium armourianum TaxID=34283 RepID=A0A7J9JK92_9ROSI|nr:hypothetical protein [Gossypium armourianum]
MATFTSVLANSRIGRATKKVQRWEEDPPNGIEMAVDMEGIEKATFKDKLLGPSNGDDDIDILEGDIRMDVIVGVPSISFSERIYFLMEKTMELTVVIKIWGRRIRFNALLNKVYTLLKLKTSIQLMDLENG